MDIKCKHQDLVSPSQEQVEIFAANYANFTKGKGKIRVRS